MTWAVCVKSTGHDSSSTGTSYSSYSRSRYIAGLAASSYFYVAQKRSEVLSRYW